MSIYISGVEMPKEHPLYITLRPDGSVHVWDSYNGDNYGTQAIYVPPHGRLINAGAVLLDDGPYEYDEWCKWALDQYLDAPTVIPADPPKEKT